VTTFCPVASAVHSLIREFFTTTTSQNEIDGPRIQYPYLEYKVNYRSQKTRGNYDNGRPSGQEGEYADEGQSFLHRGIGGDMRVAKSY
jgi:hypothetical protein